MKITGDFIGKIIVIILVALFLGLTFLENKSSKSTSMGFPGGAPNMAGAGAAGAAGGMSAGQAAGRNSRNAAAAKTVTVNCKTIEPETIQQTVRVSGDVAAKTEVNAYPITSGKVSRILKNVGDTVKKGDIIAYIDPSKPGSNYAESPVTAPVSGTIISRNGNLGDTASAQQAFASIGTVKDLTITVYVSEKYSAYLKVGLPAAVSVTSAPDEQFDATITAISPVVNKTNRTVEVTLSLTKYDSRIKPGMYASVRLAVQERKNAFAVPTKALHTWNDKQILYVIDQENVAHRVIVETGLSNDFETQIISGLSAGDRVVTAGSVTDGTPVRIAEGN